MSLDVNNQNPWNVLMQLAKKVNGTDEVSHSDLQKLLKEADKNNDGLIELLEFQEAFLSSDEYKDLEEEYLAAFEAIANLDGDSSSISEDDITDAIAEYDKLAAELETVDTPSTGGTGGYDPKGTGDDKDGKDKVGDLSNKELPELKSERSGVLSDIAGLRSEKSSAVAQADSDVSEAQANYNEATKNFAQLVQDKIDAEETTNEYAQDVVIMENEKNAIQGDIDEQKSAISEANDLVSTISGQLSSLVEPPESISYLDEATQETVTKHNPEYDNYLKQKEALENELAAAEADLANKEDELDKLEDGLQEAETNLETLIVAYAQAEEQEGNLSEEELAAIEAVSAQSEVYVKAKQAKEEIVSEYDEKMDTLQDNLIAYNDAITEKEIELPDGYGVENGVLTDGKNNLVGTSEENLPDGYNIDGTSIKDTDGNVVGYVTGKDDSQQLYLIEKIEPEEIGAGNCYYNAELLFRDAVAKNGGETVDNWSDLDLTGLNSKDLKRIERYYNSLVEKYNSNLKAGEEKALTFEEQLKSRSDDGDLAKTNYEAIVSATKKVDSQVKVRPDSFEAYLNEKNVDISNTSEEQMSEFLTEFVELKYGKLYNEDYYPPVTEEQLAEYVGKDGLEALKEADETTVNTVINKILTDDTLTPYQQIQLLNSIKSSSEDVAEHVNNYFKNDDSYFYQKLDEMASAQKEDGSFEYSSQDLIEFIKQYKNVDNTSSVFTSSNDPNNQSYMQILLSVCDRAQDNEELSELSSYISANALVEQILENYEGDDKQDYLQKLLKISVLGNLNEDGNLSVEPENYGLSDTEEIENLNSTYLNSNATTSEKLEKILEDLNDGTIDNASARYLVSSILDGKPENIVNVESNSQIILSVLELYGDKS